jgi:murein tripeptide amidase MpaA
MKAIAFLSLFFCLSLAKVTYHGEKVLSVQVADDKNLILLEEILRRNGDSDVWTNEGILVKGENHIRVKNTTQTQLERFFETKVFIEDVQALIDQTEAQGKNAAPGAFFDNYQRYAAIVAELKSLAAQYPTLTRFTPSIGKSVEGRDIPAIVVSAAGFKNASIQRFFFAGGQHAREWIGPATVMYQLVQLLQNYGTDTLVTTLLQNLEFVIVPLSNPDGYEYAFTNERLWRKNRKKNTGGSYGVDLNRNWNDHWGGSGSSSSPTSDTYRGTGPFSEPETLVISNYIISQNQYNNILGAIDFHSYSQLVLRPFGWTTANSPDNAALKIIGDGVSYEIQKQSGKSYTSQRSIDLYITTGTASDWYYSEGIWAAYTIELRDTGTYGFVLPPAQIIPTGQEIWASLRYFIKTVYDTYPY